MERLAGVRAVITGAGSGIGRAVLRRYIAEGARVVAVIRNPKQQAELEAEGAVVVVGDVAQHNTAARAVAQAETAFGGLDTYVANAGLWDFYKRVDRQTPDELAAAYHEIFGVNLLGALYGAHAALPALKASGGSVMRHRVKRLFSGRWRRRALHRVEIRTARTGAATCQGICPIRAGRWRGATARPAPGYRDPTRSGRQVREMDADAGRIAEIPHHVPLGRISEPEDHCDLYVMLAAQNESRYITGTMMLSDGGLTISV